MRNAPMNTANGSASEQHASHDTQQILPVPNATTPYWRTQLHWIDEHRSTEELPVECDVVIIGAGMSGVATAYHLCDQAGSTKPSIVMLEARQVCSGATGRNGGHVKIQALTSLNVMERHGVDAAEEFAAFVDDQIYALKGVVEKEALDCEFELRRSFDVFLEAEEAKEVADRFRSSLKAGQRWTRQIDMIDEQYAEQVTAMKGAKAAFSVPACSLWPYKFVSQLLERLVDRSLVNLQTNTPVKKITQDGAGWNYVHTARGALKARKVVFATNAYTSGICRQYTGKIVPYKGTATHICPTQGPVYPHLSHTYNISYPAGPGRVDYLNPRPDGGIVVGGGKWKFSDERSLWDGNWDDSTLLPDVQCHFNNLLQRHFRGWENSGAKMDHLWTGIMGRTADEWPHVGEVPGSEGQQYVLAGFNGGGMSMIFLCAQGVAKMIDGTPYEQSGLPRLFKTSVERLEAS